MLSWLVRIALFVILLGPALAAYALVPGEALRAWPAVAVTVFPALATVVAGLVFHTFRPLLEEPLPTTAAGWLRAEVQRLGKVGIGVAAMDRGDRNRESFYHPASSTIVLADDVFAEHSARAHATAAHELGHALFHLERPRLSGVLMGARLRADAVFHAGAGLLVGAVLVGGLAVRLAALGLITTAMVLHALVIVDEAVASAHATTLLRRHLGAPDQARVAGDQLWRALATYVARLASVIAGLAVAAWVSTRYPGGVLVTPAPDLDGWRTLAATIGAAVVVAGAVVALVRAVRPRAGLTTTLGVGLSGLGLLWCPLFVVLLCAQAGAPAWAIACAAVPAWTILSTPLIAAVRVLGAFVGHGVTDLTPSLDTPRALDIRRVSKDRLASREEPNGLLGRAGDALYPLWAVPLALWWLT